METTQDALVGEKIDIDRKHNQDPFLQNKTCIIKHREMYPEECTLTCWHQLLMRGRNSDNFCIFVYLNIYSLFTVNMHLWKERQKDGQTNKKIRSNVYTKPNCDSP